MLVETPVSFDSVTQADIARFERECAACYAGRDPDELRSELQTVLDRMVRVRQQLHQALTERHVDAAEQATRFLLHLEAQAAALRASQPELTFPPRGLSSGPQDRRKERRRTARE